MPASTPRRIYLDACVLLALVKNETGRANVVTALLDDGHRGGVEIITSVLSISEVVYGELERDAGLSQAAEATIEGLWEPASPITLTDVSETTTRTARGLIREAKTKGLGRITPIDALHLASAVLNAAEEFFTYEEKKRPIWQQLIGIPVNEPSVVNPQLDYYPELPDSGATPAHNEVQ